MNQLDCGKVSRLEYISNKCALRYMVMFDDILLNRELAEMEIKNKYKEIEEQEHDRQS